MHKSTEIWASRVLYEIKVLYETDPATNSLWTGAYPMPIGRKAVRELYASHGSRPPEPLLERLPLEGHRWALRALCVMGERSVLDMFGLEDRSRKQVDGYFYFGGLAYSLRGIDDTSLLPVVRAADDWWRDLSVEPILGRPGGSGTFRSREEFIAALTVAVREVRAEEGTVTQERVERALGVRKGDGRQLRKWVRMYGLKWPDVKKL